MFPRKKALNKAHFTAIRNPTAADICQMHANAVAAFPGESIVAARLDIASAYDRIHNTAPTLLAAGNGIDYDIMSGHMALIER